MGAHINPFAGREFSGAHVIKEYERSNRAAFGIGQNPADFETAEVLLARADDEVNGALGVNIGHLRSPEFLYPGTRRMYGELGWSRVPWQEQSQEP